MDNDQQIVVSRPEAELSSQLKTQMLAAYSHPRNEALAVEKAKELACEKQDLALGCFYSLPRAGKRIQGPSVRLAEIMAYTWGNLHVAARIVDVTEVDVVAQAVCVDLQNNFTVSNETRRRITDKNGKRYNDDMIVTTANAARSLAFRDAVFRVIPKAYVERVLEAAREVAFEGAKDLSQRREVCIKFWEKQGVTKKQVLDHLGYSKLEEVTVDDLDYLVGIANGIKARDYDAADVFSNKRTPEVVSVDVSALTAKDEPPEQKTSMRDTLLGLIHKHVEDNHLSGSDVDAACERANVAKSIEDCDEKELQAVLNELRKGQGTLV